MVNIGCFQVTDRETAKVESHIANIGHANQISQDWDSPVVKLVNMVLIAEYDERIIEAIAL